jgi:hypothetical protein
MYINFNYLKKSNVSYQSLIALQAIHQNRIEKLNSFIVENFDVSPIENYITRLKNGDLRLNKNGKDFLDKVQIPGYHENDEKLADYLLEKYSEEKLIVCPKNKLLKLIAWFRSETSFSHREIYDMIVSYFDSEESQYNKRLDYLFFKPENAYSQPNLQGSRLYSWYEYNKDKFNFN